MRCSEIEAIWDDARTGPTPPSETFLAHLRRCRTCKGVYDECESLASCLGCLAAAEPPATLGPRILQQIRSMRGRFRSSAADGFALLPSPLGELAVAWRPTGVSFVGLALDRDPSDVREAVELRLRRALSASEPPSWVRETVASFFAGWHADMTRVDITELSAFDQAALHMAAQIPPGEVRSYGWIAREIGHPQSARAVGRAMARNPVALFFPCHRVVDSNGRLHEYAYGVDVKARILRMEGYRRA